MATVNTQSEATIKAYEAKVAAQIQEAKARLQQFEAQAKEKKAQADVATINSLKSAKESIDRRLQDLKKTHAGHVTQAKAEIDADIAALKTSLDQFAAKFKTASAKK